MSIKAMNNLLNLIPCLSSDELKWLIERIQPVFLGPDVEVSYAALEVLVSISSELHRRG